LQEINFKYDILRATNQLFLGIDDFSTSGLQQ
jgi:hypothetical protein